MRRTSTILNRFTTYITSWWVNTRLFPGGLCLALLVLLSCEDEKGLIGIKNPNRDFSVIAKEFTIPTKVFQMDSLNTSYGYVISPANGTLTDGPARFMCGSIDDPRFGKTTARAYMPYYAVNYPASNSSAVFQKLTLTLIFDYYWYGAKSSSEQEFQVYELTDSMLTYLPHYSNQSTPYGKLLGQGTHVVSPIDFDQNIIDNGDTDELNNIMDSLTITLDPALGHELLAAAMDTIGNHELDYNFFYKFRTRFKGLAIVSPNSDKIVGFDPTDAKTRITLDYKIDTATYQLVYRVDPPQQTSGAAEYTCYTQFQSDRSGTPLAGLPAKYEDFEPTDGMRYVQAGTGVITKLDFSEVADYFKNIPVKALSVAELRIESDDQDEAPTSFLLRALKPNNRNLRTSTQYTDGVGDPFIDADVSFYAKHLIYTYPPSYDKPFFRADILGDDGAMFNVGKVASGGTAVYTGYLTNYLQQELALADTDFLRYYALIPQAPGLARGVNGFYFPADKVKLKVYYTTPALTD